MGSIVGAVITAIVSIVVAFLGYYYKEKRHVTELVDRMYSLLREREEMFKEIVSQSPNYDLNDIAYLQLQAKHLLMEVRDIKVVRLKIPQLRLFAEICETFSYLDDAKHYWEECMAKNFPTSELESEYHRRYGQFLYEALLNCDKGEDEYKIALKLPNDNAGQRYLNYSTYVTWIVDILESETSVLFDKKRIPHNTKLLDDCIRKAGFASHGILNRNKRDSCHKVIKELSKKVSDRKLKLEKYNSGYNKE